MTAQATHAWVMGEQEAPPGPDTLIFSMDGAMVPLVEGVWSEARTLTVGKVTSLETAPSDRPHQSVTTTHVTSFLRMTDRTTFGDQALDKWQRWGIETAGRVGVVVPRADHRWRRPWSAKRQRDMANAA